MIGYVDCAKIDRKLLNPDTLPGKPFRLNTLHIKSRHKPFILNTLHKN